MSAFTTAEQNRLSAIAEDADPSAVSSLAPSVRSGNWPLPGPRRSRGPPSLGAPSPLSASAVSSAPGSPRTLQSPIHPPSSLGNVQNGSTPSPSTPNSQLNKAPGSPPDSGTRHQFGRAWRDKPPRLSYESAPPQYTLWDVTGPKGERLVDLRNNKFVAKRGGWKRLLCVISVLLALAIGLGVGLGVGLVNRNNSSDNSNTGTSPGSSGNTTQALPAGRWNFTGNLDSVSTSCTSNPSTFLCWPYSVFASSASSSAVEFQWIIAQNSSSEGSYTLSTSADIFSLSFANASLSLLDAGTPSERYSFSLPMDMEIPTAQPIDGSNATTTCLYSGTTLAGNLYTRRPADGNATGGAAGVSQPAWRNWQFAFDLNQTIAGGADVPMCYQWTSSGELGQRITQGLTPQPKTSECGCYWRNYDL